MNESRPGEKLLHDCKTDYQRYQVIELVYENRPARVLYSLSGAGRTAQSGVALDGKPELLFDYNQRLLEIATAVAPQRLLLIGGGGYTLPTALLKRMPALKIDVVEPDAGLQAIGRQFFGLPETEQLRIFNTDGRSYLAKTTEMYDMVVIDAFSGTKIPRSLSTLEATQQTKRILSPKGMVAMNIIASYYGQYTQVLRQYYAAFSEVFAAVQLFAADRSLSLLMPQNFVLTGSRDTTRNLDLYVRYGALQPPRFEPTDMLHDEL